MESSKKLWSPRKETHMRLTVQLTPFSVWRHLLTCGMTRSSTNMILLSWGDIYWGPGLLRWLEFVGYGKREKRSIQRRRRRVSFSLWLNAMLHICRDRKVIPTRERKMTRRSLSPYLLKSVSQFTGDCTRLEDIRGLTNHSIKFSIQWRLQKLHDLRVGLSYP